MIALLGLLALVGIGVNFGAAGVLGALLIVAAVAIPVFAWQRRQARNRKELAAHAAALAEQQRLQALDEAYAHAEQQRLECWNSLVARFGEDAAHRVLARKLWQGATGEMVREMLGAPGDVARRVFKTKTTETWKYGALPRNRYRLRVMFENDVCVGWEEA
jgi:hypothetical protein